MILCGSTTEVDRRVAMGECGHLPRRKSGVGRRRVERVKKSKLAYITIDDGS